MSKKQKPEFVDVLALRDLLKTGKISSNTIKTGQLAVKKAVKK